MPGTPGVASAVEIPDLSGVSLKEAEKDESLEFSSVSDDDAVDDDTAMN
jgi:hypothetical protein